MLGICQTPCLVTLAEISEILWCNNKLHYSIIKRITRLPDIFRYFWYPKLNYQFSQSTNVVLSIFHVNNAGLQQNTNFHSVHSLTWWISEKRSQDNVVCIVTKLWDGSSINRGSIHGVGKRILSSQKPPDQLWGPPTLFFNGYRWLLGGQELEARSWQLTSV